MQSIDFISRAMNVTEVYSHTLTAIYDEMRLSAGSKPTLYIAKAINNVKQ
jgi:hypothetical protein